MIKFFDKNKKRFFSGFLYLLLFIVAYKLSAYFLTRVSQPINFNHYRHVVENPKNKRYNCLQCHVQGYGEPESATENDSVVELYQKFFQEWKSDIRDSGKEEKRYVRQPEMVIPNIDLCATCHAKMKFKDAKHKSKELKKIIDYAKKRKQINWQRNYKLKSHLNYSHTRHINFGKVSCEQCHGDVSNMKDAITHPVAKTLDMFNGCLACHKKRKLNKITTDCLSCHH